MNADVHVQRKSWLNVVRSVTAGLLAMIAVVASLGAAGSAYATFATNDYRPILIDGVWKSAQALLAFQASALVARGWKVGIACMVGGLLVIVPLADILRRLAVASH